MRHDLSASRAVSGGWTLIEQLIAAALTALLLCLALPGMHATSLRLHRSDALVTLARVQLLQQSHRSNHPRFATLSELGIAATTANGRFQLSEQPPTASGFSVLAVAQASQQADARCSHLRLEVDGADTRWASGGDLHLGNGDADNRRCWGR